MYIHYTTPPHTPSAALAYAKASMKAESQASPAANPHKELPHAPTREKPSDDPAREGKSVQKDRCRCGSLTHLRVNHSECPLNPDQLVKSNNQSGYLGVWPNGPLWTATVAGTYVGTFKAPEDAGDSHFICNRFLKQHRHAYYLTPIWYTQRGLAT